LRAESAQSAVKQIGRGTHSGTYSNNSKFQAKQPMNKTATAINSCNEPAQTFAKRCWHSSKEHLDKQTQHCKTPPQKPEKKHNKKIQRLLSSHHPIITW